MSGPETSHEAPAAGPAAAPAPAGSDPSMEDILASIRRILSEDEAPHTPTAEPEPHEGGGVLALDPAMIVAEPAAEPAPIQPPAPIEPETPTATATPPQTLVAPEAAEAAAGAFGSLFRTLAAERQLAVRSNGPTIEDIVREEMRPLLKAWLDANLPALVERLVRAEIERVVGRAVP